MFSGGTEKQYRAVKGLCYFLEALRKFKKSFLKSSVGINRERWEEIGQPITAQFYFSIPPENMFSGGKEKQNRAVMG